MRFEGEKGKWVWKAEQSGNSEWEKKENGKGTFSKQAQ